MDFNLKIFDRQSAIFENTENPGSVMGDIARNLEKS